VRRQIVAIIGVAWLLVMSTGIALADTQGSQPASSTDKNLWLGIVVLVVLVGSLFVIRPRPRR
jgi:hypothetical protein